MTLLPAWHWQVTSKKLYSLFIARLFIYFSLSATRWTRTYFILLRRSTEIISRAITTLVSHEKKYVFWLTSSFEYSASFRLPAAEKTVKMGDDFKIPNRDIFGVLKQESDGNNKQQIDKKRRAQREGEKKFRSDLREELDRNHQDFQDSFRFRTFIMSCPHDTHPPQTKKNDQKTYQKIGSLHFYLF